MREVSCQKDDHFVWSREVSCRRERFHVGEKSFHVADKHFMSEIKFLCL